MKNLIEWHKRYFPQSTPESQMMHLEQEIEEFEKSDMDHVLEELADIYIVACSLKRWKISQKLAKETLDYFYYDFTEEYRKEIDKAVDEKIQIVAKRVENGEYFWNGVDYDRNRW